MSAREETPTGAEGLVRDALRVVTLGLIEHPHPQYDSVSQAVEILAVRGMVVTPEEAERQRRIAEELRTLKEICGRILLDDTAGPIDAARLRVALRDAGIDLAPDGGDGS